MCLNLFPFKQVLNIPVACVAAMEWKQPIVLKLFIFLWVVKVLFYSNVVSYKPNVVNSLLHTSGGVWYWST